MNLTDLGNIGEFISAVAVVISLLYLGFQIRQNTRSLRASAHQAITVQIAELNRIIVEHGEVARILERGLQDLSALSPEEQRRHGAPRADARQSGSLVARMPQRRRLIALRCLWLWLPTRWRRLHSFGSYFIWVVFDQSYLLRAVVDSLYAPFAGLLGLDLGVRILRRAKVRRAADVEA